MNESKIFKELLKKYKISEDTSEELQEKIVKSRKSNLKKILKSHKKYSFFYGLALAINLLLSDTVRTACACTI